MKLRIAPTLALALSVLAIGVAGTASASAQSTAHENTRPAAFMAGNGGADVEGMGGSDFVGLGTGSAFHCPSGYFCLFTLPGYQGTMFALSNFSQQYTLTGWYGNGSYANKSNSYTASILDRNGNDLRDVPELNFGSYDPGWSNPQYNFSSASYVTFYFG